MFNMLYSLTEELHKVASLLQWLYSQISQSKQGAWPCERVKVIVSGGKYALATRLHLSALKLSTKLVSVSLSRHTYI